MATASINVNTTSIKSKVNKTNTLKLKTNKFKRRLSQYFSDKLFRIAIATNVSHIFWRPSVYAKLQQANAT